KTWYLYKLEIDGEEYEYYSLEMIGVGMESQIMIRENFDDGFTTFISFDGCPGWGVTLNIEFIESVSKFITGGLGYLPFEYCQYGYYDEYAIIEELFHSFYHYGSIIEYSFETIDAIEFLIFTDENNDKLFYTAENLSTPDFDELVLSIYPNPAQDQLFIQMSENSAMTISAYDIQDRLMERFQSSSAETSLDVSKYASGLYFIKLTDELGIRKVKKFIKQ